MPCYDPTCRERDAEIQQDKIDALTRMLCNACREHEPTDEETAIWWAQHQIEDQRREQAEREQTDMENTRIGALRKLSPDERRALGLRPWLP